MTNKLETVQEGEQLTADLLVKDAGGFLEQVQFSGLLAQLEGNRAAAQPSDFLDLCAIVAKAFPEGKQTDAHILQNRLTPDLVRYIARAFADYLAHVEDLPKRDGKSPTAAHRHGLLAAALLANKGPGRPRSKWTEAQQVSYVVAAAQALREALQAGKPWSQASRAALDAAYAVLRSGSNSEESGKDRRKNRNELRKLLQREGFHEPPGGWK